MENGCTYTEVNFSSCLLFYQERRWFCKWFSYKLNIVHRLFHLVDWKFCGCLNFHAQNRRRLKKWKTWFTLFMITITVGVSDEEEAAKVIETDLSNPVSHKAADQSKLVNYTDSSGEEEDLHVEPIDLVIN